ncbi:putative hydrolase of the HAD superfamily [Actinokineospora alba]|uniref:Putative hydrolase of the HAD superfamily n=1 Tax=Actinokineospora alba TaxID=504798 RepID=A0A1H0WGT3_9PSEU|nr:HAD-IA family hydrolase [Actinokineospora alba]TDP65286.1 putative hydrolase of the HAD superfamily [Actinokineospora alba]SDH58883.1 putative hydrolase of the HAD superfamily [Actinokineospora alba]SDP89506.1 putative hydrolase of the HAD superfamily [Actinokineospora alba]
MLLLDLDGVLRGFHSFDDAEFGLAAGSVADAAFSPELLTPAITGLVSHDRWLATVARELSGGAVSMSTAAAAVAAWSRPGYVITAALALVRAARVRCRVALLTNATTRLPHDMALLGLDSEVDGVISSAETGARKPEPEAYLAALALLDATASATLFCDDSEDNVLAAQALGFAAAHVPDTDSLRTALSVHGLLG